MLNSGSNDLRDESADRPRAFETTQWSLVLDAAAEHSPRAQAALETLCRTYWQPMVSFLRHRGYRGPDAEDLVQGFFARLLERKDLQAVRRDRGRFRSYLLAGLKYYLINEWKRAGAEKRGGGQSAVSLDELVLNQSSELIGTGRRSPDQDFDREWAIALLARVLARLRDEYRAEGKERHFDCLQGSLTGQNAASFREMAADLDLSEGAVKQASLRLRQRYQKLLRREVSDTVATFGDVEAELRHLIAALRS